MSQYDVALATHDPKTLYRVVKLLNRIGVPHVVCAPGDVECEVAKVILTTPEESDKFSPQRVVIVHDDSSPDSIAIEVMIRKLCILDPTSIVIGVDPGMRFGLALVIDGTPVLTKTSPSPYGAAERTKLWLGYIAEHFPHEVTVRVGTGSRLYSVLYLRSLKRLIDGPHIEMVDEHHTTLVGSSDQFSAVLISSRQGLPVSGTDLLIEPKTGYIRSLKQLSKRLSGGAHILTTEEAESVILGEILFEELIGVY